MQRSPESLDSYTCQLAALDGRLYFIGDEAMKYNTAEQTWRHIDYPKVRRRGQFGVAVLNSRVYTISGREPLLGVQYYLE